MYDLFKIGEGWDLGACLRGGGGPQIGEVSLICRVTPPIM